MAAKKIEIDFSDVPSYEALPPGRYPVMVVNCKMMESQDPSKPGYLNWGMDVTDGEYSGRRLFMNTNLGKKSLWFLRSILENLGIFQEKFTLIVEEDGSVIEPDVEGKVAVAVVSHEQYNGQTRHRVDELLPVESGAPAKGSASPASSGSSPKKTGLNLR